MSASFTIKSIKLYNFRNYETFSRDFIDGINKIIGPNATGKTNLLEAISLLTQTTSFKNTKNINLINSGKDCAKIEAEIFDEDLSALNSVSLEIKNSSKKYTFNGKSIRAFDFRGKYPSVSFCPDDLEIIKGSNSLRLNYIDSIGCQISKDYYIVCKDYEKALSNKNKILKDGGNQDLIKSINDVLIVSGTQLLYYRYALIKKIMPFVADCYSKIANNKESLEIKYFASWDPDTCFDEESKQNINSKLAKNLESRFSDELNQKRSIIGPHRDKLVFLLQDADSKIFASQGQQRSIMLALKLAEVQIVEATLEKKPIILLDDVLSELDDSRRQKLLDFLKDFSQSFITST